MTPETRHDGCDATGGSCTTCGDVALPARVLAIDADTARVRARGVESAVAIDFVPGVHPGDVVMVHAGIALARRTEEP